MILTPRAAKKLGIVIMAFGLLLFLLNGISLTTCEAPGLCVWTPPLDGVPLYAAIAMIVVGAILIALGYFEE